jgi:hypothetical protein
VVASEGHQTQVLLSGSDLNQPVGHGSQRLPTGARALPQYLATPMTTISGRPAEVTSAAKPGCCCNAEVAVPALSSGMSALTSTSRTVCRSLTLTDCDLTAERSKPRKRDNMRKYVASDRWNVSRSAIICMLTNRRVIVCVVLLGTEPVEIVLSKRHSSPDLFMLQVHSAMLPLPTAEVDLDGHATHDSARKEANVLAGQREQLSAALVDECEPCGHDEH